MTLLYFRKPVKQTVGVVVKRKTVPMSLHLLLATSLQEHGSCIRRLHGRRFSDFVQSGKINNVKAGEKMTLAGCGGTAHQGRESRTSLDDVVRGSKQTKKL